jgi:hypothetical protein
MKFTDVMGNEEFKERPEMSSCGPIVTYLQMRARTHTERERERERERKREREREREKNENEIGGENQDWSIVPGDTIVTPTKNTKLFIIRHV